MKISEDTISILNNFSSINAALLFNEGSDIFTISEAKNILAKASVDETFPREFGIYQLSEFLSAVSLLDNPDFDFNAESVKVKAGNSRQTIKYSYTDPSLITSPPNKGNIDFPEPDVQFVLDKEDLKTLQKASGVLHLPHVCVKVDDGKLSVSVMDMETPNSSNAFDLSISDEETIVFSTEFEESDLFDDYCMTFDVMNLKLFPGKYLVEISNKGLAHFVNQDVDVEYWISAESQNSTISV